LSDNEFKKSLKKNKIFGAFISNQLVGCAGFFIHKLSKMRHCGVLFGMYVKSENRNFHIGDELVKTVLAYAKDYVIQVHLTVVKDNLSALKLYEKHGFKIYGTEPCSLKISDQSYDEHLMILTF
jgi:ribosomal protein S18 acetylase RimI-like enzyme